MSCPQARGECWQSVVGRKNLDDESKSRDRQDTRSTSFHPGLLKLLGTEAQSRADQRGLIDHHGEPSMRISPVRRATGSEGACSIDDDQATSWFAAQIPDRQAGLAAQAVGQALHDRRKRLNGRGRA